MARNTRPVFGEVGCIDQAMTVIIGRVTTTTSGTIGSQDCRGGSCTVTKTGGETGRYTFQLVASGDVALTDYIFLHAAATVIGADDTVYTTAKGIVALIRDIDVGEGADDGTFEIQFGEPETAMADAELMDGVGFSYMIVLGHKKIP